MKKFTDGKTAEIILRGTNIKKMRKGGHLATLT
jgi:hypothetical protein